MNSLMFYLQDACNCIVYTITNKTVLKRTWKKAICKELNAYNLVYFLTPDQFFFRFPGNILLPVSNCCYYCPQKTDPNYVGITVEENLITLPN